MRQIIVPVYNVKEDGLPKNETRVQRFLYDTEYVIFVSDAAAYYESDDYKQRKRYFYNRPEEYIEDSDYACTEREFESLEHRPAWVEIDDEYDNTKVLFSYVEDEDEYIIVSDIEIEENQNDN